MTLVRRLRRDAGRVKRWLAPRPEVAAWQHACRLAEQTPRYTAGTIRLLDYTVRYSDLLTLCPQWYDIFVRETLRFSSLAPAPRIVDAGANIGLASLYFARRLPEARITAFEADPALYAMLAQNLARNRAASVEAVHAALWTRNGRVAFRCEGADSGAVASLAGDVGGVDRDVPARRLRDLIEAEPVDLLKLDIEGAELDVLQDCAPALARVGALVVDAHEFDPARRTLPPLLDLLRDAGFVYALDSLEPQPWRSHDHASPFPGTSLSWTLLIRAWRPRA